MKTISREEAFALLKKYNKDPFHIQHALTVDHRLNLGSSSDAPIEEYKGYGIKIPEKEIQEQRLCSRLLP